MISSNLKNSFMGKLNCGQIFILVISVLIQQFCEQCIANFISNLVSLFVPVWIIDSRTGMY
jgi:hypothetical protein